MLHAYRSQIASFGDAACGGENSCPGDLRHLHSGQTYCARGSDRAFCEWEAPSKDSVEQVLKANDLPFVAIYQVDRFDPVKAEFERS